MKTHQTLQTTLVIVLLAGLAMLNSLVSVQGQKPYPRYEPLPQTRLAISPGSATLTTGQPLSFKVTLLDSSNKPLPVSSDTVIQLTLTTLTKLDEAKKQLSELNAKQQAQQRGVLKPAPLKTLDQQTLTLAAGQKVVRLEGLLLKGRSDTTVKVVAQPVGQVRLFAESSRCSPGESVLIVVARAQRLSSTGQLTLPEAATPKAKAPLSSRVTPESPTPHLQPAFWQGPPIQPLPASSAVPLVKLMLLDPRVPPILDRGEWVADFRVELLSATAQNWQATRDIAVIFKVLQGVARFDPVSLTIKAGSAISEPVKLRSKVGGQMELAVTPVAVDGLTVESHTLSYKFQEGTRSTQLSLHISGNTALANNLDEIVIEAMATTIGADGNTYLLRPSDEALSERRVSFSAEPSFGVRFTDGENQITIPANGESARIKLYSYLPVSKIRIKAQSTNGLQAVINGELKDADLLSFKLPTAAIISALLGGLIWGVSLKLRNKAAWGQGLFLGGVGGFAFYIVVFFGALAVGFAATASPVVMIAKLPTASWLAAFVIGLFGGKVSDWLFGVEGKLPLLKPPTSNLVAVNPGN